MTWIGLGEFPRPAAEDIIAARLERAPHLAALWEPLHTHTPGPNRAMPYCCYLRTVIFYHRPYIVSEHGYPVKFGARWHWGHRRGFVIFDKIETRISVDAVVRFDGALWDVGGGYVRWWRKRWWMRFWMRQRTDLTVRALL